MGQLNASTPLKYVRTKPLITASSDGRDALYANELNALRGRRRPRSALSSIIETIGRCLMHSKPARSESFEANKADSRRSIAGSEQLRRLLAAAVEAAGEIDSSLGRAVVARNVSIGKLLFGQLKRSSLSPEIHLKSARRKTVDEISPRPTRRAGNPTRIG